MINIEKSLVGILLLAGLPLMVMGGEFREEFDRPGKNGVPHAWKPEGFKLGVPKTVCRVKTADKNGKEDPVLEVKCNKSTGGIFFDGKNIDLKKTPVMRWRWRVLSYPPKADGRNPRADDQPVALYVGVSDGVLSKKSVAYRWETLTPVGHEGAVTYAKVVKVHFITLRNHTTPVGQWVTESRNIAEDFKRIYGHYPQKFAISVLGNSQYTRSNTVAEVDYIEFVPESAAEK